MLAPAKSSHPEAFYKYYKPDPQYGDVDFFNTSPEEERRETLFYSQRFVTVNCCDS